MAAYLNQESIMVPGAMNHFKLFIDLTLETWNGSEFP